MSMFMRAGLVISVCAAAAGLGACGSTPTPTPTPSASHGAPSGSASASASASAPANTPSAAAAAIVLVVGDLPPGGPSLNQISDGEMNNTPNTDQRGFANADNTYRIEDDVLIDTSTQAAAADYSQLRDAAKAQVATLTNSVTPGGFGSQANEYIGKTSAGYSTIGITFQDGGVIAIVLIVDSTGTVDQTYAEGVARAQDDNIVAAAG
jgi:hypothetical protein